MNGLEYLYARVFVTPIGSLNYVDVIKEESLSKLTEFISATC